MTKENKYDLIVVGSGFASSFFMKRFLERSHRDVRVLVLERGVFYPHAERLKSKRGKGDPAFKNAEQFRHTYTGSNPDKLWVFDPNFGGSSNCWTGCVPRFMPSDFKMASTYGVGVDWPLDYETIEPYYTEVEEIMAVAGPDETPFPKSRKYPLPPQILSTVDNLLHKEYGPLYISQPSARATAPTGSRGVCCSNGVTRLCPVDAKFTIENGLREIYRDPRVSIEYDAQVVAVDLQGDIVKSVSYYKGGRLNRVGGELVALGANALFNAHILLNSGDSNPKTGAGLTEQRGIFVDLFFDGLNNVGGQSIITANGFMMYDGIHRGDRAGCIIENINVPFIRNEPGKWRQVARMKFVYEDLPSDVNRVEKSEDMLVPKVVYSTHTQYVDKGREKLREDIDKFFSFLPLEDVIVNDDFEKTEFHICSTTRMGTGKENSVVDKNLVHHKYRNLFVLGSGVFPTIAPANPTLTLSALSLMAADSIFN